MNADIGQEYVRELFIYEPDTGILRNRINRSTRAKIGEIAGSLRNDGYMRVGINNKAYSVHRIAFLYVYGYLPEFLDHINGDKLDNRISNLRPATRAENQRNRGIAKNNKAGFKGVYPNKHGRYEAGIKKNGKRIYLGTFDTPEEAHWAYMRKARNLFGEFARFY